MVSLSCPSKALVNVTVIVTVDGGGVVDAAVAGVGAAVVVLGAAVEVGARVGAAVVGAGA